MTYELLSQSKKLEHFLKKKKNKQGGTVVRDPRVGATTFGTEVKISKICFSELAEIAFLGSFLWKKLAISAVFFVITLVAFVLAYIMSNIALVLKGQKILFWRKLFEILLAFNWFIFSGWER